MVEFVQLADSVPLAKVKLPCVGQLKYNGTRCLAFCKDGEVTFMTRNQKVFTYPKLAKALGKQVVIATATVALQEQIMFKDIPELKANTDMDFSSLIAKGRGRYLCLSKLENILRTNSSQEAMQDLYGLELEDPSKLDKQIYQDMMDALDGKRWQGDRDDWPETLDNQQASKEQTHLHQLNLIH